MIEYLLILNPNTELERRYGFDSETTALHAAMDAVRDLRADEIIVEAREAREVFRYTAPKTPPK